MPNKYQVLGIIVVLGTAFAVGRYTAPEKVKIEHEIVTTQQKTEHVNDQKNTDVDRDRHRETTTTEITRPDGTKEKTTRLVEDTKTEKKTSDHLNTDSTNTTQTSEKTTKEVQYRRSSTQVGLMGGVSFGSANPLVYGGYVSKNLIGPISIGLWGLSSGVVGASAGLSF